MSDILSAGSQKTSINKQRTWKARRVDNRDFPSIQIPAGHSNEPLLYSYFDIMEKKSLHLITIKSLSFGENKMFL